MLGAGSLDRNENHFKLMNTKRVYVPRENLYARKYETPGNVSSSNPGVRSPESL